MSPVNKLVLPPRDYIHSVMMARSHEITHHKGERCVCGDNQERVLEERRGVRQDRSHMARVEEGRRHSEAGEGQ